MDILHKTKAEIKRERLLKQGDTVAVGVSGGMDSITLLYLLQAMQLELGIHLRAIHVNHHLHKKADQHEGFVRRLCHKLNVPLTCCRVKIRRGQYWIEYVGSRDRVIERLEHRAEHHRLAGADLAGHQDYALAVLDAVLKVGEDLEQALGPEQILWIRRQAEWYVVQSVELSVHCSLVKIYSSFQRCN